MWQCLSVGNFKTKNGFIYSTIQIENIHFPFVFLFCLFFPFLTPFAHMATSYALWYRERSRAGNWSECRMRLRLFLRRPNGKSLRLTRKFHHHFSFERSLQHQTNVISPEASRWGQFMLSNSGTYDTVGFPPTIPTHPAPQRISNI